MHMQPLNFGRFVVAPSSAGGEASASRHEATLFISGGDPFGILELATHVLLHAGWQIRDILQVSLDVRGDEAEFASFGPLIKEARTEGFAFEVIPSSAHVHAGAETEPRQTP